MGLIQTLADGLIIEDPPDRTAKVFACDPNRPSDKYIYSVGETVTWGPTESGAKKFDTHEQAADLLAAAGIEPATVDLRLITVMLKGA